MEDVMNPKILTLGHGAIKVAAVGDSLTYGYGLENRREEAYPSVLLDLLGSHYQVSNYGMSGRSLLSTSDYPYLQEKNAQASLQSDADIVIIMIGSNDSRAAYWNKEQFVKEYRTFAESYLRMASQPEVFLVAPPYVPTSRFGLNNDIVRDELQTIVAKTAADLDVHFVNLYPITEGKMDYYSDGLHLTPLGNQVIAQEIFSALMR
jgi:lysophospholipase L1-like esterase